MFHDDNDSEETNDTNNVNEDFEEGDIAVEDVQENLSGNQNPSYPDIVPIYAANVIFVKPFVKDQLQKMELFWTWGYFHPKYSSSYMFRISIV